MPSERKQKALQAAIESEQQDSTIAAETTYPEEDTAPWADISKECQQACIIGYLLIIDEPTLSSGEEPEDKSVGLARLW